MGRLQVQSNGLEDQGRGGREQILVSDFQRKETRKGILFHGFKAVFFLRMEIWASEANSIRVFGSCGLLREEAKDTECAWEVDFVVLRRVHGVAD